MANKRQLKRLINGACEEMLVMSVASTLFNYKFGHQDAEGVISSIVMTRQDYLSRVSHPEPGMAPKVYYRTLLADFNKQLNEIMDQIWSLG